jgi:hypothetical protein
MFRRALFLIPVIAAMLSGADETPRLHPLNAQNLNPKTGPAVGAKIPAFHALDQSGKLRTFESLRGPKGLVLAFIRSADW